MRTYTLSFTQSIGYKHDAPERTAWRNQRGAMGFDKVFQVWPNRASLARLIRRQQRREQRSTDWYAVVPLTDGEGC